MRITVNEDIYMKIITPSESNEIDINRDYLRTWLPLDLKFVVPSIEHKKAALEYKQEYIDFNEDHINGSGGFIHTNDYEDWLCKITNAQTASQTGWVDCSTYFVFTHERIVGTVQIRHELNDFLFNAGGNIGYGVRPSERRKGYATKMLLFALKKCSDLGIDNVLVTCDKGNIASERTIIKCGGVFENEIVEENGNVILRYWIKI